MRLTIALEPADGRFVARCIEIPGTLCEAESADAALAEVRAAVHLMVNARREEAKRVRAALRIVDIDVDAPLASR